ncbi:MAG: GerW family sporulation protein [Myxococcota bacterium]
MPGKLETVVDNLLDGMHQISKIETVVGEPLQAGDAMLVPIHRLRVGFGVASVGAGGHGETGEGNYGGRGVGGGVQVEPIAIVAIAKDGKPRLMAIDGEPEQMVGQLFEQIPDLLGRVLNMVSRKREEEPEVVRFESPEAAKGELTESDLEGKPEGTP